MAYLTLEQFRVRTIMSQGDVDRLEVTDPGFVASALEDWSAHIDDKLRRRYAVPFASPPPLTVVRLLVALVTRDAHFKRGSNPSSEQDREAIIGPAKAAEKELENIADAEHGYTDLPRRANTNESGISRGGPYAYSEASAYSWLDVQRDRLRGGR